MKVRFNTEDVEVHLAGAGAGKAGWVDAVIPTPDGPRRFGDIKTGDYVFSVEGTPTKVTGVYPRGMMSAYRVTLSDGRSSICARDHLWGVLTASHGNNMYYSVRSLDEMLRKGIRKHDGRPGRSKGSVRWYIPASPACSYRHNTELPVDPYVLGVFLGNGALTCKVLTLSSADEECVRKVAERLGASYKKNSEHNYNWSFSREGHQVRTADIFDARFRVLSGDKYIPDEYLYADGNQRMELINGLFDTDGCATVNDGRLHVSYSTTSRRLAENVRELLLSFGVVSTIISDVREGKNTCYNMNVNCGNYFKRCLFTLGRKKAVVEGHDMEPKHHYDRVAVRSVEKLPEKLEMQCIVVEHPFHLYLCEDYIVTHNSFAAMQEMQDSLRTFRPDEIAFVTYTKKGVENGISRALKVNPDLTPDDLLHFKTLHALCFRESGLTGKNIMTGRDIAAFNAAFGFHLSMSEVFGHANDDDRLLQRYDAERSGSRRGVFVDGNYDRMRYDRLVNAYEAFKKAHDLVDFHDCLLRYMSDGEPLQGVKICLIDECFAPDTLVRMADGSVRAIKDIRVGEYVMGVTGPVRVTAVHQGRDNMYAVESGKHKLMYRCNSRHLIQQRRATNDSYRWEHCENITRRAFVECSSFNGVHRELPVDPYFFGLWLGNGFSREAVLVCNEKDTPTIDWLVNYGAALGDKVRLRHRTGIYQVEYSCQDKAPGKSCNIRKQLESMGFLLTKAKTNIDRSYTEKYIPAVFLTASKAQRYALLAGIIDSDGMYVKSGSGKKYRIEMARRRLMENVYELACGLGLNPTWYVTRHTTNGVVRDYYRIDFYGNSNIKCLLQRKQYVHAYDESRIPCHITECGYGDYVGITVDSPDHLFLLANGCVVHNCQDLTPLQWEVCMKAFSCAEKVRCYGDDFQCLYTYNGAAPELLIEMASHYKLVRHETSYRLPRRVYEFAKGITDVIQDKVPKDYAPADDREGFVTDLPDRNVLARMVRDDLRHHGAKPGRWMLLFRTNCFIDDMARTLEQFIVPYHTAKGFCICARDLAKIERFYRYSAEGYGTPEARERFMTENNIKDFRDGFAASELIPGIERYFYQDLVDTWGIPLLKEMSRMDDPFLLLSTVHRVKGGEADYTALFMDCTRLVHENMTLNADEELRVLYVGCTRCREGLYLVPSKSRYSLSRLVDIVREVNDL